MKHAAKIILASSLIIASLSWAQTKIESQQARFGSPVLPVFVDGETPAGLMNGTNLTFTLAATPNSPSSLHLYWNGLRQNPSVGGDYTIVGNTITFAIQSAPVAGDTLLADYRK